MQVQQKKSETWSVTQDGRNFYVELEGQTEPDVYQYPYHVEDSDEDLAKTARAWFLDRIVPDDTESRFV